VLCAVDLTEVINIKHSCVVSSRDDCLCKSVGISIGKTQIRPHIHDVVRCGVNCIFRAAGEVKLFTVPSGGGASTCVIDGEATVRSAPGVEIGRTCEVQHECAVLDVDLTDAVVVVDVVARREVLASAVQT